MNISAFKVVPFALVIAAGMTACEKTSNTDTYKHPSDAVRQSDGTYRYADGSVHNADGSLRTPAPAVAPRRDTMPSEPVKPTKPDATSQANNQADLDATAAIRKAVLAREGMSMAGKNVTIVTEKGTVTLKGEVATEAEKATIAEIAMANAGGRTVDNQIVVKPAPSN